MRTTISALVLLLAACAVSPAVNLRHGWTSPRMCYPGATCSPASGELRT